MSEITGQSREKCTEIATNLGLTCFFASADELFIDLDDGAVINEKVRASMLKNGISIMDELTTMSAGGGQHVYWKIQKYIEYTEAAALQAALGSDPVREMLTILTRDFSALFEVESEAARVEAWRKKYAPADVDEMVF